VGQDGLGYRLICDFGKSEYFCEQGWTPGKMNCPVDLPVGQFKQPVNNALELMKRGEQSAAW
jgi:hypothetical protein